MDWRRVKKREGGCLILTIIAGMDGMGSMEGSGM
jgi:hypothetical protein